MHNAYDMNTAVVTVLLTWLPGLLVYQGIITLENVLPFPSFRLVSCCSVCMRASHFVRLRMRLYLAGDRELAAQPEARGTELSRARSTLDVR